VGGAVAAACASRAARRIEAVASLPARPRLVGATIVSSASGAWSAVSSAVRSACAKAPALG
jgi:hypothetical protein